MPELRLTPLSLIDGTERPGAAGFGAIADLEIDGEGSIFVLDGLNRTVQVYDEGGSFLRAFGGPGQGPGELQRPAALAWGPEGNLWVVDPGNARFTVFDTSGELIASHSYPDSYPSAVGFSSDGLLHTVTPGFDLSEPRFQVVVSEVTGDRLREIDRIDLPFVEAPAAYEHRRNGMVFVLPIPFSPAPVLRIGAGGDLWYAPTGEPWVYRKSFSGGVDRRLGQEFEPHPVTPADRQAVLEGEEVEALRREAGQAAVGELASRIPETKPHLEGFFLDDQGNAWFIRTPESANAVRTIELYDPSGSRVAVARAALEPEPGPRVRGDLLAGVVQDERGVESVALYRIRR